MKASFSWEQHNMDQSYLEFEMVQARKEDVLSSMAEVLKEYRVAALTQRKDKVLFDFIQSPSEILLSYQPTVLSPKKFFFPQEEVFLEYTSEGKITPKIESPDTVLFGIRPCDTNALKILDEAFSESNGDPNYLAKRDHTVVISIDCNKLCDHNAFCYKTNSQNVTGGADMLLYDLNENYAIKIFTQKGKDFLDKYIPNAPVNREDFHNYEWFKGEAFKDLLPFPNLQHLPEIFETNRQHPIWGEEASRCLSCGSCVFVCPTCYCFDVADELALNLKEGERIRRWDACQLHSFAKVAGGENFREETENRVRHRINKKFNYLMSKHGQSGCVGCGRCVRACLVNISPKVIAETLIAENDVIKNLAPVVEALTPQDIHSKNPQMYLPERATITHIKKMTEKETLFEVELVSGRPLGHVPGQFVQVSILGIGEAPISISSAPKDSSHFELCVRAVGDVTNGLHKMNKGDTIYIRGPFGHGFDQPIMDSMKGKHLLFISGGLGYAPLRSLINLVLTQPEQYKKISILNGCKTPHDRLFPDELEEIGKMGGNIELLETVDCTDETWSCGVGVITTLIPQVKMIPEETIAIIVGPPVMYKFVLQSLKELNFPHENIYVSLERRMKCGVGKCGHCQIEGIYVCQEGPVFNYTDIDDKEEALST
jgi:NAD(P)H-flavin reductase/NAD-dependent dihydropyrimidine dehydrogenase PreA subunit